MKLLPIARTANIAVQNLKTEILIYDLSTDKAFCLNETAAKVFNACDGRTTFAELQNDHQLTDEIIYLALDNLKKENLIETDYLSPFAGMTRREVIRRVGLASVIALPIVSGIIAPQASHAASVSCQPTSQCFTFGQDLCAGCRGPYTFLAYPKGTNCAGPSAVSGNGTCNGALPIANVTYDYKRF